MREGRSKQKLSRWRRRRTKGEKRSEKRGRRKGKMTKKSERSCQLPANEDGELILKEKAAGRERERKKETIEQKKKKIEKEKRKLQDVSAI